MGIFNLCWSYQKCLKFNIFLSWLHNFNLLWISLIYLHRSESCYYYWFFQFQSHHATCLIIYNTALFFGNVYWLMLGFLTHRLMKCNFHLKHHCQIFARWGIDRFHTFTIHLGLRPQLTGLSFEVRTLSFCSIYHYLPVMRSYKNLQKTVHLNFYLFHWFLLRSFEVFQGSEEWHSQDWHLL